MFEKGKPITIHEHTLKSDGNISFEALLEYAAANDYALVSPADHHYIELKRLQNIFGVKPSDLKTAYITLDLSKLNPNLAGKTINHLICCEFTARDDRVLNVKGNNAKYHFLVVAPKLDTYNEFLELLLLKRQNDIDYELANVEYLFRYSGAKFPAKEINAFRTRARSRGEDISHFTKELALEFFEENPHLIKQVTTSKTMLKRLLNHIPVIKRLNIPVKVLFDAVHAPSCGGLVLMAHPARNLRRVDDIDLAIENFIDLGIDGFNIREMDEKTINGKIKAKCQQIHSPNTLILDAGGNDCHTLDDYGIARHDIFTTSTCRTFIDELEKLQKARAIGKATHRIYPNIDLEALRRFIEAAKTTYRGLDYYQSFKESADRLYALENLKARLQDGKLAFKKDAYDSKFILDKIVDESTPIKVKRYLKSQKSVKLNEVKSILEGTFVTPEPEPSKKGRHDNMVSKVAQRFCSNEHNKCGNCGTSK